MDPGRFPWNAYRPNDRSLSQLGVVDLAFQLILQRVRLGKGQEDLWLRGGVLKHASEGDDGIGLGYGRVEGRDLGRVGKRLEEVVGVLVVR